MSTGPRQEPPRSRRPAARDAAGADDGPDTTTIEVSRKQARSEQAAVELARTVYLAMNRRPAPAAVAVVTRKDGWDVTFTE
ncbi:hypothetical protein [Raineyella fluvialis]|uniref:Uncharacterized protein n=1 Tax=Raineyella fluvialis TaxID=2662261 RepID=A0A5Q2FDD9_9ACTN|nr:hypothetical protein [Raineyella fluvialis]QGF24829.1 hypothetical protein Rai3103_15685 [Raineyella fluvialis]